MVRGRWRRPKPAVGLSRVKRIKQRLAIPHGPGVDLQLKREHFNKVWWLVELDEVEALRHLESVAAAQAKLGELAVVADRLGLLLNLTSFWSRFWPGPLLRADMRRFVDTLAHRLQLDREGLAVWAEIEAGKANDRWLESWLDSATVVGPRSRRSPLACERSEHEG